MPVEVTLRSTASYSPFRWRLKRLLTAPFGDSLLLCSGYIWEPAAGPWKVLDDLEADIIAGCGTGVVVTVAGKLENRQYEGYYRNFVNRLATAGVTIQPWVARKRNWHAKIAIRLQDELPLAAIVGSSNLTRPALGEGVYRWNFEGDVMIWPQDRAIEQWLTDFEPGPRRDAVEMRLVLDPSIPQPDETEQLTRLYSDIMHSDLEPFQ